MISGGKQVSVAGEDRIRACIGRVPPGAPVTTEIIGLAAAGAPVWALVVLFSTEERDDWHEPTEPYRACGRCLESYTMKALVFGHACAGAPVHLPAWVRGVLGAVL